MTGDDWKVLPGDDSAPRALGRRGWVGARSAARWGFIAAIVLAAAIAVWRDNAHQGQTGEVQVSYPTAPSPAQSDVIPS